MSLEQMMRGLALVAIGSWLSLARAAPDPVVEALDELASHAVIHGLNRGWVPNDKELPGLLTRLERAVAESPELTAEIRQKLVLLRVAASGVPVPGRQLLSVDPNIRTSLEGVAMYSPFVGGDKDRALLERLSIAKTAALAETNEPSLRAQIAANALSIEVWLRAPALHDDVACANKARGLLEDAVDKARPLPREALDGYARCGKSASEKWPALAAPVKAEQWSDAWYSAAWRDDPKPELSRLLGIEVVSPPADRRVKVTAGQCLFTVMGRPAQMRNSQFPHLPIDDEAGVQRFAARLSPGIDGLCATRDVVVGLPAADLALDVWVAVAPRDRFPPVLAGRVYAYGARACDAASSYALLTEPVPGTLAFGGGMPQVLHRWRRDEGSMEWVGPNGFAADPTDLSDELPTHWAISGRWVADCTPLSSPPAGCDDPFETELEAARAKLDGAATDRTYAAAKREVDALEAKVAAACYVKQPTAPAGLDALPGRIRAYWVAQRNPPKFPIIATVTGSRLMGWLEYAAVEGVDGRYVYY